MIAAHHRNHRIGEGNILAGVLHIRDTEILADHHQRHVAHHLGRRRHLDDVAEHLVGIGIGLRHLEASGSLKTGRARLLLQIGELAARHLVKIDFRGRSLEVALERRILVAHRFPVERNPADPFGIEAGIALMALERLDNRAQARLRGVAGKRVHCCIHRIHAAVDRRQHRRCRDPRRVMRVEMDRQVGGLAQRLEQLPRRSRFQQSGHVLDRDDMGAGLFQLGRKRGVVLQVVFRAGPN